MERCLLTLGKSGSPSDTGATSQDFRTIRRAGAPFHYPTNLALAADGSLYISDGYGNARVHKFSPDGRHCSRGVSPVRARAVSHSARDRRRARRHGRCRRPREQPPAVLLARRRIPERMDRDRTALPGCDRCRAGSCTWRSWATKRGCGRARRAPSPDATGGRVSIFDSGRRAAGPLGRRLESLRPGDFFAPHDICLDSRGDLYVGEVVWSAGGNQGAVPADCHALQKFSRTD